MAHSDQTCNIDATQRAIPIVTISIIS